MSKLLSRRVKSISDWFYCLSYKEKTNPIMDSEPSAYFSLKPNLASFGLKHISKIVILEKFVLFSDVCHLEKQQMTYQVLKYLPA